ncbi:MAG: VWA domain-containing protein [Deltaproteobacteria bacterium]|nr:VWA domain-containing protein [Deltaproteobacteria bacterium]MBW1921927.1 VWA domain-containing protein [Deltaproteobacteria bacterium]MBW1948805.1 VWA domain-containing protein [Deltaproteobacteria bacterium]MBW2006482.1 VWA domain-containing protein [Deltaproteobacteria bacterium]MBW2101178.1 VWA domain-containing protein [Deltaproteobacteria bacterium]
MEQMLQEFISALRASGVRISVAETIEAFRAVSLVGYAKRATLKDALSATLPKSLQEKEIFEECFDRYFALDRFSGDHGEPSSTAPEPDGSESPLSRMVLEGDRDGLAVAMRRAAREVDLSGIRFFTQKSLYIQRILQRMGAERMDGDIENLTARGDGSSRGKAAFLRQAREILYENVRDFVEQQFPLFSKAVTKEIMERYLRGVRLSNLEQRDYERMKVIIKKMVKRLNDLHSRRKKAAKTGCPDLKKTLRENVAYQGLLFDLHWKARKMDRPDILALCDVSRSVETVARFMLLFLYSLSESIARIRSFIFCSNLVEVTHVFEEYGLDEALERLQKGVDLGIRLGRTDYGQAFRDFKAGWLDFVTPKTTILILGDARNNRGNPETGILRLLRERSRRIIWLNPEPPTFWGIGDSEMKRYAPYCYLARECSTILHMQRVVDFLLKTKQ